MAMIYRAIGVAALLLSFSAFGVTDSITEEPLNSGGQLHHYFLFIPENAKSDAPLLLLLHGSGHGGRSLIDPWHDLASKEGVILVAPSAMNPQDWHAVDGPEALVAAIDAVRRKHTFDAKRIYLFGHSNGARFALRLAAVKPGYFAAITAHAGTLDPGFETLLAKVTPKAPIQMQIGTKDESFPLGDVRRTRDLFKTAGFEFNLIEIEGHDHDYYGSSDEVNREAWNFLKTKTLN